MWTVQLTKKYTTRSAANWWSTDVYANVNNENLPFRFRLTDQTQFTEYCKLKTNYEAFTTIFWIEFVDTLLRQAFLPKESHIYIYIFNHPLTIPIVNRWHWNFIALVYQFKNSQIDRSFLPQNFILRLNSSSFLWSFSSSSFLYYLYSRLLIVELVIETFCLFACLAQPK